MIPSRIAERRSPPRHAVPGMSTILPARSDILSPERLCTAIIVLIVVFCFGWDAPRVMTGTIDQVGDGGAESGDNLRQAAFVLLFAGAVLARLVSGRQRWLTILPALFVPVLAWCWLSLLWAIDPAIALRRIAFTTIVIATIAICVEALPYERLIGALTVGFLAILTADWIAVALFQHAVHQPGELDEALIGNWRGIHNGKNNAGAFCAMGLILFLHEAVRNRSVLTGACSVVFAGSFLYFTHSKTAMIVVAFALTTGLFAAYSFHNPRFRRMALVVFGGIALPLCIAWGDELWQAITAALADPASLTGRVQIWPVLLDFAADHPVLGAGFGSFWGIGDESPVRTYGSGWVTEIYSAHNGYLELQVQIGAVGLGLALLFLIIRPFAIMTSMPLGARVSRSLVCSLLAFGWARDLLESSLLDRAEPVWVVMVIMYCTLWKYSDRAGRAPE